MALDPRDPRLNGIDHIATVSRNRQRNIPNAQSVFEHNSLNKQASAGSVYDNVHSLRRGGHRYFIYILCLNLCVSLSTYPGCDRNFLCSRVYLFMCDTSSVVAYIIIYLWGEF